MACGTPVLAFRNGAVPEVIDDGVTGHVVDSLDEAIAKLGAVLALDRRQVRRRFEERFSATRMAKDYLKIYQRVIGSSVGRDDDVSASAAAAKTNGNGALRTS
jgi:glycosyltransferase involved in cell wall biosynthesis